MLLRLAAIDGVSVLITFAAKKRSAQLVKRAKKQIRVLLKMTPICVFVKMCFVLKGKGRGERSSNVAFKS